MHYHVTLDTNLYSIRACGLLVSKANPSSKIKGVWMCTAPSRAWAVLHVLNKYNVHLEEVVVIEVHPVAKSLTLFRRGLYYSLVDIPPSRLGVVISGLAFGAGVSD